MRILTRYILRAHVAPFLFALTILTGLLFVNTVARRFENELAGKGLEPGVIVEVFALSIPHVVALTLPMAVLVAVLYAFSNLASDNEITALKAGGINLARLLVPLVLAATVLAAGMVWFNDRVLPETNNQLATLLADINRKSPTLQLKEQVFNEIPPRQAGMGGDRLHLRAGRIEPETNRLWDITIIDMSEPARSRTIYADSGRLTFNRERTDLFLTLYNGEVLETERGQPERFQSMVYDRQRRRLPEVATQLERTERSGYRSDREMSLSMLAAAVEEGRSALRDRQVEGREEALRALERTLAGPNPPLEEEEASPGDGSGELRQSATSGSSQASAPDPGDAGIRQRLTPSATPPARARGKSAPAEQTVRRTAIQLDQIATSADNAQDRVNRYAVEYHKKFAIPFACIVFVLIGAPLAVRFPRGGVGMVIAASLVIFGIYYVGLIGGERLADEGLVHPFWSMWATNFIFLALGLWALTRIGREAASSRGGGWEDLLRTLRRLIARPLKMALGHEAS